MIPDEEVDAVAYYLAAVSYAERGAAAEQQYAEDRCRRLRVRIERKHPWYAGTWKPLPSEGRARNDEAGSSLSASGDSGDDPQRA